MYIVRPEEPDFISDKTEYTAYSNKDDAIKVAKDCTRVYGCNFVLSKLVDIEIYMPNFSDRR